MKKILSVVILSLFVVSCNKVSVNSLSGTSDADKKILIDGLFSAKKKVKINKSEISIGEKCIFDEYFTVSDVSNKDNFLKGTVSYNAEEIFVIMLAGMSSIKDDKSCDKYKVEMSNQIKGKKTKESVEVSVNLATGEVTQKKITANKG